jgi:hemerythrin-like domain-containing protein
MTDAIAIIREEHRNFMAVLRALQRAVDAPARHGTLPDLTLIQAILDYIASFMDRYHHHTEQDFLFHALKRRCPDSRALLNQLDAEHREGAHLLAALRTAVTRVADDPGESFDSVRAATAAYVAFERSHCEKEEGRVLPLAERHLTEFDWIKIEAAFRSHVDPLFGPEARAEQRDLARRLVDDSLPDTH